MRHFNFLIFSIVGKGVGGVVHMDQLGKIERDHLKPHYKIGCIIYFSETCFEQQAHAA